MRVQLEYYRKTGRRQTCKRSYLLPNQPRPQLGARQQAEARSAAGESDSAGVLTGSLILRGDILGNALLLLMNTGPSLMNSSRRLRPAPDSSPFSWFIHR